MGASPAARRSTRAREAFICWYAAGASVTSEVRARAIEQVSEMVRRRPSSWSVTASVALLPGGDQFIDIDQLRRIVAGVARVAIFVFLIVAHGFAQRTEGKKSQGIGLYETAHLFYGVIGCDQLAFRGRIDAVET